MMHESKPGFRLPQYAKGLRRRLDLVRYRRFRKVYAEDLSFTQACRKFPERNVLYAYMHHYFRHLAPEYVRNHRAYYAQEMRGFGEDALHAMWFTILREFKPALCLEIGVYRGQVTTLWALIARETGMPCRIHGISPFSSAGDEVSVYLSSLDYLKDVLESNARFGLPEPTLVKAFSTDPVAQKHIAAHAWNLVYIDGNHDFEVALSDYRLCRDALAPGGLLVMDDSSLYTDFRPPTFGFAGHAGPSRVVKEFALREMEFLGGVGHNNVFRKA